MEQAIEKLEKVNHNVVVLTLIGFWQADLPEKQKKRYEEILRTSLSKLQGKKEKLKKLDAKPAFALRIEVENEDVQGVSDLVDIVEEKSKGRHAIAKEEIAPGTVLASGVPGMAVFNPDDRRMMLKFCLNCLMATDTPLPCLTCASVVFCSPQCRLAACSSYHKYQCQIDLYSHRQHDTGGALDLFLPLKAVWQSGSFSLFCKQWDEKGELKDAADSELRRMWSMVTHVEERTLPGLVKVSVIAVFLLRCSRLTSYLGKTLQLEQALTVEEEWLGSVLAKLYMIQDMNCHPLYGLDNGQSQREVK